MLVQGCASPDAVIRKLAKSYQHILYIIGKKIKLTCLWLHEEKEKLKMKIVRFKLNWKNCIFDSGERQSCVFDMSSIN